MAEQATEAPTPNEGEDQPQSTQAPSQETSAQTESPEYFSDQFDVNTLDEPLRDRYRQMEAGLTQKFQELAEQRKQAESVQAAFTDLRSEDPEISQNALQWLAQSGLLTEDTVPHLISAFGYEIDDQQDEQPEEGLDPTLQSYLDSLVEQRVGPLEQEAQQRQLEVMAEQLDQRFQDESAAIEKELGIELPDEAWRSIVDHTMAVAAATGSEPDLRASFDAYNGFAEARMKGWSDSKRGGATTAGGQAATQVPDLDNMSRAERDALMTRMWREADEQGGP
jgi:hypothetical protein